VTVPSVKGNGDVIGVVVGILVVVLGVIFVKSVDVQTVSWAYIEWAMLVFGSVLAALSFHHWLAH
jgi:hypothetical protein